jgi:hypothetical protein
LLRISTSPARASALHQAEDHQAVDRLDGIDGVAAGDGDAGFGADALAAADDVTDGFQRQLVDRHAHQGQGHDRRATHGINVGNGVGSGNAAEVERVVDDRHEKVGGGDQRLRVVEAVDGRVVRGFDADHQFFRNREIARIFQDFRQHARCDLAAAAAPVRERRQFDEGLGGMVGHGNSCSMSGSGCSRLSTSSRSAALFAPGVEQAARMAQCAHSSA